MRDFMAITKALSDSTRVRTLLSLLQGELCVCQITELSGLAPSTVSKHLFLLRQAGLVTSRKKGRWIFYTLPGKEAPTTVHEAIDWVRKSLGTSPIAVEDVRRLKKILKMDPADLCRRQCRKERGVF